MSKFSKVFWGLRALVYKPLFGKIGKLSYIGKPTYISANSKRIYLGNKVRIYPNVRIEIVDETAKLFIGDNTSIGHNVQISSAKNALRIGEGVTIAGNVLISNNDHTYYKINRSILEQPLIYKTTEIGTSSFIGYNSVILAGVKLGKHCIVGANSVVRAGNYGNNCVLVGSPAKVVKKYNEKTKRWENV